jgi:hypothetical protein
MVADHVNTAEQVDADPSGALERRAAGAPGARQSLNLASFSTISASSRSSKTFEGAPASSAFWINSKPSEWNPISPRNTAWICPMVSLPGEVLRHWRLAEASVPVRAVVSSPGGRNGLG